MGFWDFRDAEWDLQNFGMRNRGTKINWFLERNIPYNPDNVHYLRFINNQDIGEEEKGAKIDNRNPE